jgi:hypothetical protein
MADIQPAVMAAMRRKCGYFDPEPSMDARIEDAVIAASPRIASLLGFPADHEFAPEDGEPWQMFVNGCFYEFSDAFDDFEHNYADSILSVRLKVLGAGDA